MRLTSQYREAFVDAVMAQLPWKTTMTDSKFCVEVARRAMDALPREIRTMSKKYPGMLAMVETYFKFEHVGWIFRAYIEHPVLIDVTNLDIEDLLKARAENAQESNQRDETRGKLSAIAGCCTTLKALKLALPDLVSYMPGPSEQVYSTALVDPALVSDLKKSGLPVPKGATT